MKIASLIFALALSSCAVAPVTAFAQGEPTTGLQCTTLVTARERGIAAGLTIETQRIVQGEQMDKLAAVIDDNVPQELNFKTADTLTIVKVTGSGGNPTIFAMFTQQTCVVEAVSFTPEHFEEVLAEAYGPRA